MPYQDIDATVSATDSQAIKDAIAAILAKLPFLVNLTTDERKATFKTGPNSLSFVQNALSAAKAYPDVFPASFDTAGFEKDVNLFTVLTELATQIDSLASQVDDTRLAVGGEAMTEATQAYKYLKAAAETTPGMKPIVEQLGERFQRAGKEKPAAAANA